MRKDYIDWDSYFMTLAIISSFRSKDPNTTVGACIVDENKNILSLGYNGFPKYCNDNEFPWTKDSDKMEENKYAYVVHAEMNAILNAKGKYLNNSTLYVTFFPCNECAKAIIQSRIKHVKYFELVETYKNNGAYNATRKMFDAANISYEQIDINENLKIIQKRLNKYIRSNS